MKSHGGDKGEVTWYTIEQSPRVVGRAGTMLFLAWNQGYGTHYHVRKMPTVIRCHYSRNARVDKTEPIYKVNQNKQQMR